MIVIAICDDSKSYSEIISYKIEQCLKSKFDMECKIKLFDRLDFFYEYMDENRVDIAFLDIMVNGENAIDLSIQKIKSQNTQIIFMTSFPENAYNISETNCCYYLIKPRITDDSLARALQCALQKITKKDPNLKNIKLGSKNITINFNDILYIETFNNNIILRMNSQESISVYTSLNNFSKNLPPNFLRCHKSYMVNMNHIRSYEPHKFILSSGDGIPIPPKKYKSTVLIYEKYLLNL